MKIEPTTNRFCSHTLCLCVTTDLELCLERHNWNYTNIYNNWLGVGDRHLDNLLLTPAGALFHIDFGYILGRDPKPLPPPMKLSREMVEAMGGVHSEHYHEFRKLCYTAFLHLRRLVFCVCVFIICGKYIKNIYSYQSLLSKIYF